tara:strand:+ start:16447 stop:17025 length:579 start_codon:yes stop_codon:yes gene_type:complete
MQKKLLPLTIAVICSFLFFTLLILIKGNYEFLFYLVVVFFLTWVVYKAHKKVKFPLYVLWHLFIWATLHLAGGNIYIKGIKLYEYMIFNIIGDPYNILKYDQAVHIYGFFVATLAIYYVLKPLLQKNHNRWTALTIVVVMAGLGAVNEIVEFIATVITPSTGVGGYINNALDLVTDLIGAIIAIGMIFNRFS